jgi:8-oxo-dGTP diphosphatase
MPVSDQGVAKDRYMLIPRTAIFVRREDEYLLIKGAPTKHAWSGKYNCLGGHVERGEDILSAARRELMEEAGLTADLWLAGAVIVAAGEAGISLYIFVGENPQGEIKPSQEGTVEWVRLEALASLPVPEDLPVLTSKIHLMQRGDPPFAARSYYDEHEKLHIVFAE